MNLSDKITNKNNISQLKRTSTTIPSVKTRSALKHRILFEAKEHYSKPKRSAPTLNSILYSIHDSIEINNTLLNRCDITKMSASSSTSSTNSYAFIDPNKIHLFVKVNMILLNY